MVILFTGHRDKTCSWTYLESIHRKFPEATWLCGGAIGVDREVMGFCDIMGITVEVIKPDYTKYPGKAAPIIRDKEMVEKADLIVAFYDGRKTGGTLYTINYAKKLDKKIVIFEPKELPAPRFDMSKMKGI